VLFVESVEDQWYGPDDAYFRVGADDGNTYVLDTTKRRRMDAAVILVRKPALEQFDPHFDPPQTFSKFFAE